MRHVLTKYLEKIHSVILAKKNNKQRKQRIEKTKNCIDCHCIIMRKAERCVSCFHMNNQRIIWPEDDILLKMINESSLTKVGEELDISANAIKKRLKKRGLWVSKHINWNTIDLISLVNESSISKVAKDFNVDRSTIVNNLKKQIMVI